MRLYINTWRHDRLLASKILLLAGVLAFVAGCASPEPAGPLPFQDAPELSAAGGVPLPARWWTAFGDPALDLRVERALAGSFSLAAAWERLRAARAVARREASGLSFDLDAVFEAGYQDGEDIDGTTDFSLGLEARYEVDLWGRIRAEVDAERLRARATLADYQTAALSLSGEVALAWYRLAEAGLQLRILAEQVATNEAVLELLEARFAAGLIRSADVLRQRQLLEATREQEIVIAARIGVLTHQLAVLQGRPPQAAADTSAAALPPLPPLPQTGLPAELVARRPDIRAAQLRLEAADRDLAAAVSDQYPRLSLTASLLTAAERPENLFMSWLASIAGQLVAPLLDGGERRAEVERTAALKRQALAEYGDAVLVAFQEVEDALLRETRQSERILSLERQLALARQTYDQLRTQYLNGVVDYIAVLDTLTERQRLQRDIASERLALVELRIALYRALAGDFDTPHTRQEP